MLIHDVYNEIPMGHFKRYNTINHRIIYIIINILIYAPFILLPLAIIAYIFSFQSIQLA